jgi:hypothetical protein
LPWAGGAARQALTFRVFDQVEDHACKSLAGCGVSWRRSSGFCPSEASKGCSAA